MEYTVKDSGKRIKSLKGFERDVNDNKPRYDLIPHEMLTRLANHMAKGAKKYGENNWRKAYSENDMDRFKESAFRHFIQWFRGDTDEDHASAVMFNINSYEWHKNKKSEPYNLTESIKQIRLYYDNKYEKKL